MTDRYMDPLQLALISEAMQAAGRLFPQAQINLTEAPLQPGALTVAVDDVNLMLCGAQTISIFTELTAAADMVFFYPRDDRIRLELIFRNQLPSPPKP